MAGVVCGWVHGGCIWGLRGGDLHTRVRVRYTWGGRLGRLSPMWGLAVRSATSQTFMPVVSSVYLWKTASSPHVSYSNPAPQGSL